MAHIDATATVLIQQEVARNFRLTLEELLQRRRQREYSYPRMLAMYLVRELTRQSFPAIAVQFGGVHHTSVMHACRWARDNDYYAEYIKQIKKKFGDGQTLTEQHHAVDR